MKKELIKVLEMFGEPISYGGQESVVYNMLSSFRLGKDFSIDLFSPYFADNKELISLVKDNGGENKRDIYRTYEDI